MSAWSDAADEAIIALAATGRDFTSDDLLEMIGPPDVSHAPNARNNAMGAAFSRASKRKIIEVVGHTQSRAQHRKGGLIRIWRGVVQ